MVDGDADGRAGKSYFERKFGDGKAALEKSGFGPKPNLFLFFRGHLRY